VGASSGYSISTRPLSRLPAGATAKRAKGDETDLDGRRDDALFDALDSASTPSATEIKSSVKKLFANVEERGKLAGNSRPVDGGGEMALGDTGEIRIPPSPPRSKVLILLCNMTSAARFADRISEPAIGEALTAKSLARVEP
jgi:hypothetical protein